MDVSAISRVIGAVFVRRIRRSDSNREQRSPVVGVVEDANDHEESKVSSGESPSGTATSDIPTADAKKLRNSSSGAT